MILIHHALDNAPTGRTVVPLLVSRLDLAKTRWRAQAEDGTDFGFDLEHPLEHGAAIHATERAIYVIAQQPEAVLCIQPGPERTHWAQAAWALGNLHQPLEVTEQGLCVADDPVVRQQLARLGLHPHPAQAVFRPTRAASHGHAHAHG